MSGHYVCQNFIELKTASWTVRKIEKQRKDFFRLSKIFIRNPTGMYGLTYSDIEQSRKMVHAVCHFVTVRNMAGAIWI